MWDCREEGRKRPFDDPFWEMTEAITACNRAMLENEDLNEKSK